MSLISEWRETVVVCTVQSPLHCILQCPGTPPLLHQSRIHSPGLRPAVMSPGQCPLQTGVSCMRVPRSDSEADQWHDDHHHRAYPGQYWEEAECYCCRYVWVTDMTSWFRTQPPLMSQATEGDQEEEPKQPWQRRSETSLIILWTRCYLRTRSHWRQTAS